MQDTVVTAPGASALKQAGALGQQDGIVVVYKPQGPTSAACIARIKRTFKQKKIGHAGTLDPMAEGVLLVLLGQATKLSGYLMDAGEKVYSGSIRLGVTTDTWDAEGRIVSEVPEDVVRATVTEDAVHAALASLVGTYEQEVPAYSAAKHQGKPLYELARKGLEAPVKKKTVTIFRGEVEQVNLPQVHFRVQCSSGTYIRSLAHSLGARLGCGGMLEKLVREYSHPFGMDRAVHLERLLESTEAFTAGLAPIQDALPHWPNIRASFQDVVQVKNGIAIEYAAQHTPDAPFTEGVHGLLLEPDGRPLALVRTEVHHGVQVWGVLRGLWNTTP